MTPDRKVL